MSNLEKLLWDGIRHLAGPAEGTLAARIEDLQSQLEGIAIEATHRGRPATPKQCDYLASLLVRRDMDAAWIIDRLGGRVQRVGMTSLEASRFIDQLLAIPARSRADTA